MNKKFLSVSIIFSSLFSQAIASEPLITEFENDVVDYDEVFHRWNNAVDFDNPCYEKDVTQEHFVIPNGSLLSFAGHGKFGQRIRAISRLNKVPNPRNITHSAIVMNENPRIVFEIVVNEPTLLSELEKNEVVSELDKYHHDIISAVSAPNSLASFTVEGREPYTSIHDLRDAILRYDGDVYLRQLATYIPNDKTRQFLKEHIGRRYETSRGSMLLSVRELNRKENLDKVFCSEQAMVFYQNVELVSNNILPNNIMPHVLDDLLNEKTLKPIPVKFYHDEPVRRRNLGKVFSCCCG